MTTPNWQSADVTANGIRLHYTRTGGDLPPLVLAHGFTDNGLCWTPVAKALQSGFDVIMPDARGHGLSEAPETGYNPRSQADDLAGLIAALGLDHPIVLGHSMGAITALVLASAYPTLPCAIIMEDPPDWWTVKSDPSGFNDWIQSVKSKTRDALIRDQHAATPAWSTDELEPWADSKVQLSWNALNLLKPEALTLDWEATFTRITCPALAILADPALGAAIGPDGITVLQSFIPQLEATVVPNAGHSVRRDQFARYIEIVHAFLARFV